MYGLKKEGRPAYEFDLEKMIKADPEEGRKYLRNAEEKIRHLKEILRKGTGTENFDNYGVLLHAYTALQRVLNRIVNKK